jgi:hypothetical protein
MGARNRRRVGGRVGLGQLNGVIVHLLMETFGSVGVLGDDVFKVAF